MKYKEFMKITDRWSDNDMVCFLMEYELWNEMVMRFIMHKWRDGVVDLEFLKEYAEYHKIMEHTDLSEVEE